MATRPWREGDVPHLETKWLRREGKDMTPHVNDVHTSVPT